jgi:hypothetical protein
MGQCHAVAKQSLRFLRPAAEHPHPRALGEKPAHHMAANESRATSDQELRTR